MPKKKTLNKQAEDFLKTLSALLFLVSFVSFICFSWADRGAEGGWFGTGVTCLVMGFFILGITTTD